MITKEKFLECMKEEGKVNGFYNEYYYLSNFYAVEVTCNDFASPLSFRSSEAMFQSLKCPTRASEFVDLDPEEAKHLGRNVPLRDDWESIKIDIMRYCIKCKFDQNEILKDLLVSTGKKELVEENTWGDMQWGKVNGDGNNYLGILLMELRDEYQKEYKKIYDILDI